MVETYGTDELKFCYIEEATFGVTPTNPTMYGVPVDSLDPGVDPGNLKLRGAGSYDLLAIKKGLRQVSCKVSWVIPSAYPTTFLQWCKTDLNKSLSVQVLYFKGNFASATDVISLLFTGMKFHKVSVECSIEDIVKATAELWGQDLTVGTSKIAGATYIDQTGSLAFNETYVKKDGLALDRVTDWKFDVENNLKRVPVIRNTNGHLLKYLPFRHRSLSGELTFEFESKTEADEVLADTEFDLEFGLADKTATLMDCKWDNVHLPSKNEDLVSLKAEFTAKGPLAIT